MKRDEKHVILTAKQRFKDCESHWGNMKQKNTEILRFISGEQWTDPARQQFENSGFAALTSNRIPTFLRQITNEIRKHTPEIQVNPMEDNQAQMAELINDLIRNIQEESRASIAYADAAESAASIGIGYFRIINKYVDNKSMDQELCIEPIEDANLVMLDPNHKAVDGSDSEYAFITNILPKEEYLRKYDKSALARLLRGKENEQDLKITEWTGTTSRKWQKEDTVIISEYFMKDYEFRTLYQVLDKETNAVFTTTDKDDIKAHMEIVQEREITVPVVKWYKINDVEILDESTWPGEYIPIVAVKADEYWIDGQRKLMGAVEPAMDAQVELNYTLSYRAQLMQLAPKAPYIGAVDQFKSFESQWANINVSNQAFIPYNIVNGAPPPQRDLGEVPIQAASLLVQEAEQSLQAIFGTFEPANDTVSPESGKAILARQHEAYNSNYHFYDNLQRSIQHAGVIMLDAIPVIYDSARNVQVQSIDGKKRSVQINQPNELGVVEYDLTKGKFTVQIQAGPSFGTRRQETVASTIELLGVYPQAAPAIADIVVRNMDWPGAQEIADSLEAMVPPQVLQARKVDPKQTQQLIPQLKAQVAQLQQQNQAMTQQLQVATSKMQENADKLQVENLKAHIEMKKSEMDAHLQLQELELDKKKLELEFIIKQEELRIAQEKLELEKAQVGTKVAQTLSNMADNQLEKTHAHIEKIVGVSDNTGSAGNPDDLSETITGPQGDLGGSLD